MISIDKVQFSPDSGFDPKRAMELANLIEIAYDEYEVWDYRLTHRLPEELPPDQFICSSDFIDLSNTIVAICETIDPKEIPGTKPKVYYEDLDRLWQTKTTKQYKRLTNFWATEWWWLNILDVPFVAKSLMQNLGELFHEIRNVENLRDLLLEANQISKNLLDNLSNLVRDDQLFGFIAQSQANPNEIFVVFRGTREQAEWFNNFRPIPKKFLPTPKKRLEEGQDKLDNLGEVRNGFNRIYTEKNQGKQPTILEKITKYFEEQNLLSNDSKIFITGHSLGAGLATLAAAHISKIAKDEHVQPSINLYTFASPRVGDETFAKNFDSLQCYRIINSEDLIQAIPLSTTQVVSEPMFQDMHPARKARTLFVRGVLETITNGQSTKHYQHVGIPITFTKQTGTIASNHNLAKTYREALNI